MSRLVLATLSIAISAACLAADAVKVYEAPRKVLTGPFKLKGPSPQQRLAEFKPVEYPAVYIENEYLRCCLLPTVGGRVYEVYNKASQSPVFFVNPYLETHDDDFEGGHPWNLGGIEVNFPYFHHGNTYNDRWQWARFERGDGSAGVSMSFTSRPSMQRAVFQVVLRPGTARVDLGYRFENLNPYSWGLAAWIDTMHAKTMQSQFILPSPWVASHGHNVNRNDLQPWPVRNGEDLSWQKSIPGKYDLSEFAFMPRLRFHGCYEHASDRGAVRIFDPATLPAAKLWTQAPPVTPDQYYQHFEIWTATSAVMEDPGRQAELGSYSAADAWYQVRGIGGYVFANADAALNLVRRADGSVLAGVCGTRKIPGCVASLRVGHETICRHTFALDPAAPWKSQTRAPAGDVVFEVTGPDGASIASYELRADELPEEQWKMPPKPRWREGINAAYHEEDYSTLWRRRGHFMDGAIHGFQELLKKDPGSAKLTLDLARAYLKDQQVRVGFAYGKPGPEADADAAKRRTTDLESAVGLLRQVLRSDPGSGTAHFYLGLTLERQGKPAEAIQEYRAALAAQCPAHAGTVYLCRHVLKDNPAEALSLARRAAQTYPQSSRVQNLLLVALLATGLLEEANTLGERLLGQDPSNAVTVSLMADVLKRQDKAAEAQTAGEEFARLCRSDPGLAAAVSEELSWLRSQGR
jgi:tetratricopeptide (TPR) repeat protein